MKKIILVFFLVATLVVSATTIKTPKELKSIEKELKKDFKDVFYQEYGMFKLHPGGYDVVGLANSNGEVKIKPEKGNFLIGPYEISPGVKCLILRKNRIAVIYDLQGDMVAGPFEREFIGSDIPELLDNGLYVRFVSSQSYAQEIFEYPSGIPILKTDLGDMCVRTIFGHDFFELKRKVKKDYKHVDINVLFNKDGEELISDYTDLKIIPEMSMFRVTTQWFYSGYSSKDIYHYFVLLPSGDFRQAHKYDDTQWIIYDSQEKFIPEPFNGK